MKNAADVRAMVAQCENLISSLPEKSSGHMLLTQFVLPGLRSIAESLEPLGPLDAVYKFGSAIKNRTQDRGRTVPRPLALHAP